MGGQESAIRLSGNSGQVPPLRIQNYGEGDVAAVRIALEIFEFKILTRKILSQRDFGAQVSQQTDVSLKMFIEHSL